MATSIGVHEATRNALERVKREFGASSFDQTLVRLLAEHEEFKGRHASGALLQVLVDHRREVRALMKRHNVASLRVFGSAVHGDARPESDLDLLVTFEYGKTPGLIAFGVLERELSEILGVDVDLQTPEALNPRYRQEVIDAALEFHVQA
jgi:predicted nucleotidyltransferase